MRCWFEIHATRPCNLLSFYQYICTFLALTKEKALVTHPIRVARLSYRGTIARKRENAADQNRIAAALETYINARLKSQTRAVQSYLYHEIAEATGHALETIRDLCFSIDGGHNGFTAYKSGMTFEEALDAAAKGN
jgi:hypothetical protein